MRNRHVNKTSLFILFCLLVSLFTQSDAKVLAVKSYVIPVSNLSASEKFYSELFGFNKIGEYEVSGREVEQLTGVFAARLKASRMQLGNEEIELVSYISPSTGKPIPVASHSNDLWFQHLAIVVSDMPKAYQRLRNYQVRQISPEPQTLPSYLMGASGISAIYFHDPDGHVLELIQFPVGEGAPQWSQPTTQLFMRITHSAIGVSNTEKSLQFYKNLLGLEAMQGSTNYGKEQERLTGVFGCKAIISPVGTGVEPHIELIEYRAPSTGRPYPQETYLNDLWAWQIRLEVDNLNDLSALFNRANIPLTSPNPIIFTEGAMGFSKAQIVRDPDGHFITLVEGAK